MDGRSGMSRERSRGLRVCAAVAIASALVAGVALADESLLIFDWSGYDDPNLHQGYVEKHGKSPSYSFFADDDEGFQKVRAGFKVDLAHPCLTTAAKWREAGLLKPIDTSRLPAWNDLLPALRALPGVEHDGKVWLVPFDWGNAMLVVRTDLMPEQDRTLDIFTNPAYHGRVAISSLVDDAYALALLKLGYKSFNELKDPARRKEASDYLVQVRDNQRFYWTDPTALNQALASGEVVAAWAWNQSVATLQKDGVPVAVAPRDKAGVSTYVCGFVKLAGGEGSEALAYDYINAALEPRSGKYLLEAWAYGHSNSKAFGVADKKVITQYGFDDPEGLMKNSLFQAGLSVELQQALADEFEKIKSGF
jgi:spermidine/putrescine transport system substrate-binding protein